MDYLNDLLDDKSVMFKPGEGKNISIDGGMITFKITSDISKDQLGVYEISLQPGTVGARLHFHRFMDETFIVNRGILTVQTGPKELELPEGSVIYIPRFTPHGFSNKSATDVTVTLIFNPAQSREGFFIGLKEVLEESPVDPAKFLKLYNKYDSYPVDEKNMIQSRNA